MSIRQVILCTSIASALVTSLALTARGANVNWDPTDTGGPGGTGSANWDTADNFWWNGTLDTSWFNTNNDTAVFGSATAPTTVTLTTGITAGGLTFNSDNYTIGGSGALTLAGTPTITVTNSGQTATITAPITGAGFTKAGAGTLVVSPGTSTNSFTSAFTLSAGTLQLNSAGALGGTSGQMINFASTGTPTLVLSSATAGQQTFNKVTMTSVSKLIVQTGAIGSSQSISLQTSSGTGNQSTIAGTVEVANMGTTSGKWTILNSPVSLASGLVVTVDSGSTLQNQRTGADFKTLNLNGAGNAEGFGALRLSTAAAGTTLASSGIFLQSSSTIGADTAGDVLTAAIKGTATTGNIYTLTLGAPNSAGSINQTGVISNGTGGGQLAVTVAKGATLNSANTYTGSTAVNGGTLVVSGSLNGTANVSVASGATLASGVTGAITTAAGGNISVDGTLAPGGLGSVGALTLAPGAGGQLSFVSGSTMALDISGAASDQVAFSTSGDWLLGSGKVTLNLSGLGGASDPDYANTYTLFHNVTTTGFNFASITGYDTADFLAHFQQVGSDYQLSFTAIPEPGTAVPLLGGLGMLIGLRRRQRSGRV